MPRYALRRLRPAGIIVLTLLLGGFLLTLPGCKTWMTRRPYGVIIVLLDSARADHFGVYGYSLPTTREIDRIAKESLVFDKAYSVACFTYPSVASLWTGLHILHHGLVYIAQLLPTSAPTLPLMLQEKGVKTALFATNRFITSRQGFARGVDHYEFIEWSSDIPPSPHKVLQRAYEWIKQQKKPFFAYIHLMQPHSPYTPPDDYVKALGVDIPPRYLGVNAFIHRTSDGYIQPTPEQTRGMITWYDANIRWADDAIGRFYRSLKEDGFLDHVWLVITSDHGEAFGEHGEFYHVKSVYEETIHVPLIIRPPARARAYVGRYQSYVYMQDLYPTVLEWFGVRVPDWVEFRTLSVVWKNPRYYGWREQVSCTGGYSVCALRRLDWKVVVHQEYAPEDRLPLVEVYRLPNERWIEGNVGPGEWQKAQELYRLFRLWQLTGRFEIRQEDKGDENVRWLRQLGYLGAGEYAEAFYYAPTWLKLEDLQGEVRNVRWEWDAENEFPALAVEVRNRSSKVWSALSLKNRGGIQLTVKRQKDGRVAHGRARRDIFPERTGWFKVLLSEDWLSPRPQKIDLALTQEGGQVVRHLESTLLTFEPYMDVDASWSRETFPSGLPFHWLVGTRGQLIAVHGGTATNCLEASGTFVSYARPRRMVVRDAQQGTILWQGVIRSGAPETVSWRFTPDKTQMLRRFDIISLDGAKRPLERMESDDPRPLSFQARNLKLKPCSSD